MPPQLQEIEGRFHGENYRFGDVLIGTIRLVNGSQEIATLVGHNSDTINIKGAADPDELERSQTYRFYGRFSEYKNKRTGKTEKQFHFHSWVTARAHDREGIIAYLERAGRGIGMGRGTAARAWDAFGGDAVRVIREQPERLISLNTRITEDQANQIADRLKHQQRTEDAEIEITNLLSGRGFPKVTSRSAIKEWGNRAAQVISRDPYALMRFRGCGFRLCDQLWIELGLNPARMRRQALCAWYSVASDSEGHTWFPAQTIAERVKQSLGSIANPVKAIKLATRLGRRTLDHYGALAAARTDGINGPVISQGGQLWLAEGRKAWAEGLLSDLVCAAIDEGRPRWLTYYESMGITTAEAVQYITCQRCGRRLTAGTVHLVDGMPYGPTCVGMVSSESEAITLADYIDSLPDEIRQAFVTLPKQSTLPRFSLWPEPDQVAEISDHQREQYALATTGRLGILCGSPGTGKTYVIAQVVKALLRIGKVPIDTIAIGAPTGKAAVRISEAMQAAGLPLRARTWHSLLGVGVDDETGTWGFQHNESNPWPYRVILGDESSMLDTTLMCSVFRARARGCHVLLVGDTNQLPPVGHGAPLRDMIAAEIPCGELREIKRNSGGIVESCASIRDGAKWDAGDNLIVVPASGDSQAKAILDVIQRQPGEIDQVWDCQVIVAVNAKSPLSRKKINDLLQGELNPNPKIKGSPFRLDDKIVCLKNGKYTSIEADDDAREGSEGNEVFVANGEIGRVIEIEDKYLVARLTSPYRMIRIPRGKAGESARGDESRDDEKSAATGCDWDLAYAISCHKSQGSEFPIAIVALDEYPGARRVCSREWLYTAISRAKSRCYLVGKKSTADSMCRRIAIGKRKTLLKERIRLAMVDELVRML